MPLLRLEQITKRLRAAEVETTALDSVSLDVESGDYIAILGPSGSGKSTLLNILGLLETPTQGRYLFEEKDVGLLSDAQRARLRARHIGFVFQSFNLIDELTVAENIELPLLYSGVKSEARRARSEELLERFGIAHRLNHFPHQLSGGQQQRVAIARSIVGKPSLLLADEPTGNLDSQNGTAVMDLIDDLNNEGATIVTVTHSAEHALRASRQLRLFDGRWVDGHTPASQE